MSMKQEPNGKYEWRRLYLAALFERDRDRLLIGISQARTAIVQRGHQLIQTPGETREMRALDAALDALHALRSLYGPGQDFGPFSHCYEAAVRTQQRFKLAG